jgi:uncharacterized protein (DUF433 family)
MNTVQSINLIATNPNVRRGRAHIVGTSVTVADVAMVHIYHGEDADGIASWYDLTLPQVYAALAYYYDRKNEIDEQIRAQIRHAEELAEKQVGDTNSLLPR